MIRISQPAKAPQTLPAIELLSEQLISFSQAARMLPPSRCGRPVSPSCIWRWSRTGVRVGKKVVLLESVRIASRLVTSVEAIKRFIENQQDRSFVSEGSSIPVQKKQRTNSQRARDSENALRSLTVKRHSVEADSRGSTATNRNVKAIQIHQDHNSVTLEGKS